ncbi:hypothetical protein AK88_04073 [Plasmodium fragile]|uniref:Uncharacterized protein n=1 Tax=Plasmodium fragile TaxID=5857 RepID=A0A0D9QGX8_PLAFR|nr:uncharacterized protein AK88_04073 [Plasmodium fragile]KJP86259.1 hypothetical protein AK88_04073 [Plasmodium fragile]
METEAESLPGKKSQGGKNEKDLQSYMDELWGFGSNSEDEEEHMGKKEESGKGVVTTSEESQGEANDEWGGKKVKEFVPRMLPHHMNKEDGSVFTDDNAICASHNGSTSSGNCSDGEDNLATGKKNVGNKKKRKKGKNGSSEDLTVLYEKDNFYPMNDKKRKKEEDMWTVAKGTKGNVVNEKLHHWDGASCGAPKQKTKKETPDEATKLVKKNMFKEKMEAKKDFMNVVHEIRKLTLPHLDKFQRKIVENHQVQMLGGKFDKSPKVHYPELMFRKKSIKKYIQQRREREKVMGVKTQTGNYIDMQDVNRMKKRMKREKSSSKLF